MTQFKGRGLIQLTGRNPMAINIGPSRTSTGYGAIPSITLNGASSNTISLGSANGMGISAQALGSIDPDIIKWNAPNTIKYEIVESKQDLLALSVAWKRYRSQTDKVVWRIDSMLDDRLFEYVNEDDIKLADTIRDYYSKKFTVLALKNIELSPFRKDLKELVNSDGKKFKESLIPLAYRMPEFYEYDTEFEDLLFTYNRQVTDFEGTHTKQTKKLELVKTFLVNTKRSKRKEYWFSDEFNNLIQHYVDIKNPLLGLMDKFVKDPIRVTASFKKWERDGNEFIKMHDIDFG